jgi:hypothetical protein
MQRVQHASPEPVIKPTRRTGEETGEEPKDDDDDDAAPTSKETFSSSEILRSAVLSYYEWATSNDVTPQDYLAYERFKDAGALAWKNAICRSVLLSREPVRSLSYCAETLPGVLDQWDKAKQLGLPDTSEGYLRDYLEPRVKNKLKQAQQVISDPPQRAATG